MFQSDALACLEILELRPPVFMTDPETSFTHHPTFILGDAGHKINYDLNPRISKHSRKKIGEFALV